MPLSLMTKTLTKTSTKPKYKRRYRTQEEVNKMFELRAQGLSYAAISRQMKLPYNAVRHRLANNLTSAYNSVKGNTKLEKEFVRLRSKGYSYAKIAELTNQNHETVRSTLIWLNKA